MSGAVITEKWEKNFRTKKISKKKVWKKSLLKESVEKVFWGKSDQNWTSHRFKNFLRRRVTIIDKNKDRIDQNEVKDKTDVDDAE